MNKERRTNNNIKQRITMKSVYEVSITTPSGQVYSHFFSSWKAARMYQTRVRTDWHTSIEEHDVWTQYDMPL